MHSDQYVSVSKKLLLSIYLIIPVVLGVVLVDFLLLENWIQGALPLTPDQWAFWTVFFGMPHIVASMLTITDKEYLKHYNRKIWLPLIIFSLAVIAIPNVVGQQGFLVIFASYTIYHVLAQQFGIASMMLKRRPDRVTALFKWSSVIAAIFLYALAFGKDFLSNQNVLGINAIHIINAIVSICLSTSFVVALKMIRDTKQQDNQIGQWYLWSNVIMLVTCYFCALSSYPAFVVIIPRVIHDVTAFIVYSVHDQNRNKAGSSNFVYNVFTPTKIPVLVLSPLISIIFAYFALRGDQMMVLFAIYVISFFHYHMESFIWKGDSLHRHYVPFR